MGAKRKVKNEPEENPIKGYVLFLKKLDKLVPKANGVLEELRLLRESMRGTKTSERNSS